MPDPDRSTSRPLDEADLSGFDRLSQPSRAPLEAAPLPSTSFILSDEQPLRAPVPASPSEARPIRPAERASSAAPVASERRRETARRAQRSAPAQAAKPAPAPSPRRREALGILLLSSGLFVVLSLLSLVLGDGTLMGPVGRWVAGAIYSVLGAGTLALGGGLLLIAVRCLRAQPLKVPRLMLIGVLGGCLAIAVLLHLVGGPLRLHGMPLGGVVGEYTAELGVAMLGTAGTLLVAVAMLLLCVLAATPLSVLRGAVAVSRLVRRALLPLGRWLQELGQSLRARLVALRTRQPAPATSTPAPASSLSPAAAAAPAVRDGVPVIIRDYGDDRDVRDPTALPAARRAKDLTKDLAKDAAKDKEAPTADKPASSGPPPVIVERRPAARPEEAAAAAAAVEPTVVPVAVAVTVTAAAAPRSPFGDAPTEASGAVGRDEDQTERTAIGPGGDGAAEAVPGVVSDGATDANPSANTDAMAADGPVVVPPPPPKGAHELDAAVAPAAKRADDKPHGHYVPLKPAYEPPPLAMFDFEEPPHREFDRRAMLDLAQRLESTLADYLVKGRVAAIHPGPVVTMYEFVPAPGIKLSKITALSSDLAMALEALRVRIVAPIPGKAAVGIEVPNRSRETVFLKEILADEGFRVAKSKLTMALGKDISGAPVNVDLAKMPHLLVAGTTGSGKSVSVNAMVCSLLVNASPDEVKMIMIDPKMLELSIYEGIPHLLLPVVTEPKKANLALKWAVDEMERRYDLISKAGVRDIGGYNKKIEKQLEIIEAEQQELFGDDDYEVAEKPLKLPYIVVLIDEFADLMMVASKEVETSVARIAQKARAAGIHLILATQRPSVDVITGLIKANFPSRIAFQVASRIDSRTILDQQGAENLLGMGDMLFTDRGQALRRVHGALITDSEIHRVVEHLKQQGKPIYDMDILKPREEEGEEPVEEDMSDELYDQAVRIVAETRQASISMVQRRLRIGYNRAARMIERMEREGIVGPADGVKGREVLITNL